MATAGNQKTKHPAYTGGVDWILRFRDGDYATHGQIVGSITGPDTRGWGGFTRLAKEGGEHFLGYLEYSYSGQEARPQPRRLPQPQRHPGGQHLGPVPDQQAAGGSSSGAGTRFTPTSPPTSTA